MALDKILGQIVGIAQKISNAARPSAPPPPPAEATSEPDEDAPVPGNDEVLVTQAGEGAVLISWQLGEPSIARAQKLKPASSVAARLFVVAKDAVEGSTTTVRERAVGRAGEWLAAELPRGALVIASVGLTGDDAFVSVAHSTSTTVA